MTLRADITGVQETIAAIGRRKRGLERTTQDVLEQCGQIILKLALKFVPVRTGTLHSTGRVKTTGTGKRAKVNVFFGGRLAPYAVYVHENPLAYHNPPTMYKFLERAVIGTRGTRAALVKRALKTELTS